jgi:RNA polymerase sigma-70 factor, ECF subfamily
MSLPPPIDFERVRLRDRGECERLVREHYRAVYSQLFRWVGNEEDAADLTQETFRKVWQKIDAYRGESDFATWVFRIAHNTALDWHRKTKRLVVGQTLETDTTDDHAMQCFGLQKLIDDDERRQVAEVVNRLGGKNQEVIVLHYLKQLTIQQTADTLGIALGTAKWRLNQALAELRRVLAKPPTLGKTYHDE